MGAGFNFTVDADLKKFFMNALINDLKKKFGKNIIQNENLSKYSWFNLGGPAEFFLDQKTKNN